MAAAYEYVAWFRDERLPPDDQDYEWPAVFIVVADSAEAALAWGDRLAADYAQALSERFIHSGAELASGILIYLNENGAELPVVFDGVPLLGASINELSAVAERELRRASERLRSGDR
ncbi:MAG: hypothetical protein ABI649_05645 [Gaiellaceae bacterium]